MHYSTSLIIQTTKRKKLCLLYTTHIHAHTHIHKKQPTSTDSYVYRIYIAETFLCLSYKLKLPHFTV